MRKIIKKYGNSRIITFSSEECKIYHLKEGKVIEIEIIEPKIRKEKKK